MHLLYFLIIFPALAALGMLFLRHERVRDAWVKAASAVVCAGTLALLVTTFRRPVLYIAAESRLADQGIFFLELLLGGYFIFTGLRWKKPLVSVLSAVQLTLLIACELLWAKHFPAAHNLFVDKLSILMALVVGVIGSLIAVYAVGYMRDFHRHYHRALGDNRPFFFFVIFIFLSAMFGVIFSNNLVWLSFFWEVTTLCSFLLIGYKKTDESRANAFKALAYNLIGGVAFVAALAYLYSSVHTIELSKVMFMSKGAVLLPAALICFAGLTKSAQLPFSSWLLGAMVAPTPVSALLHSSTMVKAGVYIIVRFALVLQGSSAGFMLALIGAVTFLLASFIAVSQSDAKKILAYSTIANLGLIVLCAGVGTYQALWAAGLLIIFHAIAKCLLFLCVGTIEHKVHSRDIEHMSGLIISMPKLSIMLQIGMAGMFLAPFGMLISKWAVLKALVDYHPLFAVFVIFGSGATLFFWVKWMGKLIIVTDEKENLEAEVTRSEWVSLTSLSFLTIGVCGLFPVVSSMLIEPYVIEIYGRSVTMSQGNIVIMSMMLVMVMLFPLSFINYGKKVKVVDAYLAGANTESHTQFRGSMQVVRNMEMKNYYLEQYFGEKKLFGCGVAIGIALLAALCVLAWLSL